jgi:beta-N-acetylhexosaminidase
MGRTQWHRAARGAKPRFGAILTLLCLVILCLLAESCTANQRIERPAHSDASPPRFSPTAIAPRGGTPARSSATPKPSPAPNPGGLTDAQLVGQLFVSYVYGSSATGATAVQRQANLELAGATTGAEIVRRWHLGGIILIDHNNLDPARPLLSTGNVDDANQLTALTSGLQRAAVADSGVPLLIGTDQEGGSVQRITNGVAWRPSQLQLSGDTAAGLRCSYQSLGRQLLALGVNQDYAPVADVVRVTGGVIGDRSFGADPAVDARDVHAAVQGLQAAGVLATLKHWPGHGSTPVDSHESLPVLTETAAQWRAIDRLPFAAAAAIAGSVMVGHLALPALDRSGQPATLSPLLIEQQLRGGLGYRGLVLTDSLWMAPMREAGTPAQVAIRAIQAGADMLLESPDLSNVYRVVLSRVQSDPAFRSQVRDAVRHILAAKALVSSRPAANNDC